jgi:hypothetical protein
LGNFGKPSAASPPTPTAAPLSSHPIKSLPSDLRSTAQDRPYPFMGIFAKETPTSLVFEPTVLGYLDKSEFLFILNPKIV